MSRNLSMQFITECFLYDRNKGELRWKSRPANHFLSKTDKEIFDIKFAGKIAGSIASGGHRQINIERQNVKAHHIVWFIETGKWPDKPLEHIDGNKQNNKISNLRVKVFARKPKEKVIHQERTEQEYYDFFHRIFEYEEETGILRHKYRPLEWFKTSGQHCRWNKNFTGKEAGAMIGEYKGVVVEGKSFRLHRIVWLMKTGKWPKVYLDHIDRNPINNRFENLREATPQENLCNRPLYSKGKFTGVFFAANKWKSVITAKQKRINLGEYDTELEAKYAYCLACLSLYKEFTPKDAHDIIQEFERQYGNQRKRYDTLQTFITNDFATVEERIQHVFDNGAALYQGNMDNVIKVREHKTRQTVLKSNGYTHTDESKEKISAILKEAQKGERNSQFGKVWMTNGIFNLKTTRDEVDTWIQKGYRRGRSMKGVNIKYKDLVQMPKTISELQDHIKIKQFDNVPAEMMTVDDMKWVISYYQSWHKRYHECYVEDIEDEDFRRAIDSQHASAWAYEMIDYYQNELFKRTGLV